MAATKICAAPDCGKKASGTYCEMHRARLRRGGSLEPRQPRKSLAELLDGRSKIGEWQVLSEGEPYRRPTADGKPHPDGRQRTAHCRCVCGVERDIPIQALKSGQSKHCGCRVSAMTTEMKTTHGMSRTPEHRAWAKMKERCFNPNNKDWHIYGGRGITVCERWRNSFEAFFEDMGLKPSPRHSLDRYPDQDGNYEPGNVRWATARQQALNLRVNRLVTVNGETLPLKEACRRLGIADRYKAVHRRMKKGATFEEARPS